MDVRDIPLPAKNTPPISRGDQPTFSNRSHYAMRRISMLCATAAIALNALAATSPARAVAVELQRRQPLGADLHRRARRQGPHAAPRSLLVLISLNAGRATRGALARPLHHGAAVGFPRPARYPP